MIEWEIAKGERMCKAIEKWSMQLAEELTLILTSPLSYIEEGILHEHPNQHQHQWIQGKAEAVILSKIEKIRHEGEIKNGKGYKGDCADNLSAVAVASEKNL